MNERLDANPALGGPGHPEGLATLSPLGETAQSHISSLLQAPSDPRPHTGFGILTGSFSLLPRDAFILRPSHRASPPKRVALGERGPSSPGPGLPGRRRGNPTCPSDRRRGRRRRRQGSSLNGCTISPCVLSCWKPRSLSYPSPPVLVTGESMYLEVGGETGCPPPSPVYPPLPIKQLTAIYLPSPRACLPPKSIHYSECFDSTLGFPGEGPTLVFLSNNIRGGLTGNAWWDAISAARGEKADIIGFQEINIQKDDPRLGSLATSALNLGYTAYFAPIPKGGTRGGTAILVKTSLQISKTTFNYMAKGGISYVTLAFSDGLKLKVVNVYAPHTNRKAFFTQLKRYVTKNTVLMGDFNCVPNKDLDLRRTSRANYPNDGADTLEEITSRCELIDEIRIQLGAGFAYTHIQKVTHHPPGQPQVEGYCLSRIDRHYLPNIPDSQWTSHLADCIASDHSVVISTLESTKGITRGHDLERLDATLILEPSVHTALGTMVREGVASLDSGTHPFHALERIKYRAKAYLRKATKQRTKKTNAQRVFINAKLQSLRAEQTTHPTAEGAFERSKLMDELTALNKQVKPPTARTSHSRFRKEEIMSREFWSHTFPKSAGASSIASLNKVDDWDNPPQKNTDTDESTDEIASAASKYFAHLAKEPTTGRANAKAEDRLLQLLSQFGVESSASDEAGADISIDEVTRVLQHLPEGKASGPDRIPNEFYKTFANGMGVILAAVFNKSRQGDQFPEGFKDGIVTLLYKKGTRKDVRNYRPITLLNGDYKVLTRILAKRLANVITQVISDPQLGFVPRTNITEATRLLQMIQIHLDEIDEGGLFLFLDLEKAFDRCSWSYLHRALRALNFTTDFTSWTDLLYDAARPPKRKVYANGFLSEEYEVKVGTAQGCPLSPLLFLIIVEGFTRLCLQDTRLEGIKIGALLLKILHFADDTMIALRNPKQKARVEKHINTFCLATNMRENADKREHLPLGTYANKRGSFFDPTDDWEPIPPGSWATHLGIPIGNNLNQVDFLRTVYQRAKSSLARARGVPQMSLSGRHKILNANYYGTLRYYLWTLTPSEAMIKAVEEDSATFLWRKKPELDSSEMGSKKRGGKFIAAHATHRPVREGGAGVLHFRAHLEAFRAKWILMYLEPRKAMWKLIFDEWLQLPSRGTLLSPLTKKEKRAILSRLPQSASAFRDALKAFWRLRISQHEKVLGHKDPDSLRALPLFRNAFFKVLTKGVASAEEEWHPLGFSTLGSLFNQLDGTPLSSQQLKAELVARAPALNAKERRSRAKRLLKYQARSP